MEGVEVVVQRAEGVKCPRCWHYTGEGRFNMDNLCDRCYLVLAIDYAEFTPPLSRWKQEHPLAFNPMKV